MELIDLGYNQYFETQRKLQNLTEFDVARVIIENKERYLISTNSGDCEAQITGKLRFTANNRLDFPAVGDWVAITKIGNEQAIIHEILKRKSLLARKSVDNSELQIIAANIDATFITTSVDRDFNLNRIDRYLTIINSGHIQPIIVLTKIDLISDEQLRINLEILKCRYHDIPIYSISSKTDTVNHFFEIIEPQKTYCFIGSSGVGKSTIINKLAGYNMLETNDLSTNTNKGKHTTTHRELIVFENKGILIDTPGMREIGITYKTDGIENTFAEIIKIAENCKFNNCTHTNEDGCAVLQAIENNNINLQTYKSYLKLEKERAHLETSYFEKRIKDKKFGKMVKQIVKEKKKNKF